MGGYILDTSIKQIVALGDSITYGYPYSPEVSWTFIIEKQRHMKIINKGINGDTLEGMLERFDEDVKALLPEILIVMGGTNDAFGDHSISAMEYNLRTIVERAEALEINPVVGMPIPTDDLGTEEKLTQFREYIHRLCKQKQIPIIDFYSGMVDKDGKIKSELDYDGIHPNRKGYLTMAKIAERVLESFHN